MSNKEKILNAIKNKNLVKVISGIKNYDLEKTLNIAKAGEFGGATAVDICDSPEIIKAVKEKIQIPVFVSSVDPKKLIEAVKHGADALEIGNYESFYIEGKMFTPSEILGIVKEVKNSVSENIVISCTIPATLEIENQIKLADELLELGVDIIQTEGFAPLSPSSDRSDSSYDDVLKASSTLTNTLEISKNVPGANVMSASGITPNTAPIAIAMGAVGVGVGNYISKATEINEMSNRVKEVVASVNSFASKLVLVKTLGLKTSTL